MVNILSLVIKYFLKGIIYQVNKYFIILHLHDLLTHFGSKGKYVNISMGSDQRN